MMQILTLGVSVSNKFLFNHSITLDDGLTSPLLGTFMVLTQPPSYLKWYAGQIIITKFVKQKYLSFVDNLVVCDFDESTMCDWTQSSDSMVNWSLNLGCSQNTHAKPCHDVTGGNLI